MAKRQHKFAKAMLAAGMPQDAVDKLIDSYVDKHFTGIQEFRICPDPHVEGTYAIRIVEKHVCYSKHDGVEKEYEYLDDMDLLWNHGDYDEVEFETWPPISNANDLKFFI
jgi:hypothetical protein